MRAWRTNLSTGDLDRAARQGGRIPWVWELPADLVTPVAAALMLARSSDQSFLLESAERGTQTGRWSFLGWEPVRRVRAFADRVETDGAEVRGDGGAGRTALRLLREGLEEPSPVAVPGLPPFSGGWVGMLAYDAIRWFEPLPPRPEAERGPWLEFGLYETVLAVDHLHHRILLVTHLRPEEGGLEAEVRRATERLEPVAQRLLEPRLHRAPPATPPVPPEERLQPRTPRPAFLDQVRALQEHIRAGDIFQAVLSQRFEGGLPVDPFEAYRVLRRVNPSPYLFFLRFGDRALAGSSPEMLVRVSGDHVETHPIAGTRPRGDDPGSDARLESDLRADPKEMAEHVMLVDLGRNDLGRIARPGSVRVEQFAQVERYSHVMHLVSRVTGRLAPGFDALDALVAAFPAGTVTGAPKVRAMQLLDALEPVPRGPYAGAVAYLGFGGSLDSCIAIRTLVAEQGRAWIQAGAGIVADSVPEREYQETLDKARVLWEAVGSGGEGPA